MNNCRVRINRGLKNKGHEISQLKKISKYLPVWKVTVGNVGSGGWLIFKTDPLPLDPACRELAARTLAADVDAPVTRRGLQIKPKK